MKTVIIGCTHAGTAAVQELVARDPLAEVAVFERRNDISFLSCGIYLYLEGVVDSLQKVFYATAADLEALGPNVHVYLQHDVVRIDTEEKVVEVQDLVGGQMRSEPYDRIIMTTGSYPVVPPIQGVNTPRVFLCKNYDDAMAIEKAALNARKIAVVGGGYIGTEISEALSRRGFEVVLINGRKQLLGHYVDPELAGLIHDDLVANGVELHDNEIVEGFEEGDGGVYITTNQGELQADMAIVCVGFSPMTELVQGLVDLTDQNAIMVNDYMQTSNPDIFAAGDSAAVHYNPTNRHVYAPLATNAVRMGKIAGANVAEYGSVKYMGTQATSALALFGKTLASTGLTAAKAAVSFPHAASVRLTQNYRPDFMPTNEQLNMVLVYNRDNRKILGAQFYSRKDVSMCANLISTMIQNGNTIDDLAYVDMLFNPNYDQPWNYLNLLGQAAVNQEKSSRHRLFDK
ncbi:FAD-dependent oxidoreductase [Lacticaseibacillus sharpeae]|uniref:NADH oxidase n=1 Tax=Lacticaseibacillus sharpeae JCM 1186 = DSM 20505 TaxID=1291052 RepID=A0A0R1ZKZ8_9LACO|nr:FAD-dependent oxidoreductase [Lacticaseibacillus sharpeae]KRM55629.1 NADH oxidase [Lacticaseibacillus sharpeae JCM 1186 = DSM 20505]